jgi:hypothetical protein
MGRPGRPGLFPRPIKSSGARPADGLIPDARQRQAAAPQPHYPASGDYNGGQQPLAAATGDPQARHGASTAGYPQPAPAHTTSSGAVGERRPVRQPFEPAGAGFPGGGAGQHHAAGGWAGSPAAAAAAAAAPAAGYGGGAVVSVAPRGAPGGSAGGQRGSGAVGELAAELMRRLAVVKVPARARGGQEEEREREMVGGRRAAEREEGIGVKCRERGGGGKGGREEEGGKIEKIRVRLTVMTARRTSERKRKKRVGKRDGGKLGWWIALSPAPVSPSHRRRASTPWAAAGSFGPAMRDKASLLGVLGRAFIISTADPCEGSLYLVPSIDQRAVIGPV